MSYANPTNVTTVTELWEYNNTVTDDIFTYFILFAIWGVMFFASSRAGRQDYALVGASFITFISAVLLVILDLATMGPVLLTLGAMIVSFIISKAS